MGNSYKRSVYIPEDKLHILELAMSIGKRQRKGFNKIVIEALGEWIVNYSGKRLLPCPFCGGKVKITSAIELVHPREIPIAFNIDCDPCGILMFCDNAIDLAANWNRRNL